jgi:hypothetical protein
MQARPREKPSCLPSRFLAFRFSAYATRQVPSSGAMGALHGAAIAKGGKRISHPSVAAAIAHHPPVHGAAMHEN